MIGGGIAGLTAAALLAQDGIAVTLLEAHHQAGGCAGTFRRGPWIFDVGATQVAGLEELDDNQALPDLGPDLDISCLTKYLLPPDQVHDDDDEVWDHELLLNQVMSEMRHEREITSKGDLDEIMKMMSAVGAK